MPEKEQPGPETGTTAATINERFESAPVEQQVELINRAIKAKPRKLVKSRGIARNKYALFGVLGLMLTKMVLTGFESGHWYPFYIAGIVAVGIGIWWATA